VKDKVSGEWKEVELPEGYTNKDVTAAGYSSTTGKEIKVEVKHEVTDRRSASNGKPRKWRTE
jgi:hypothetical protein